MTEIEAKEHLEARLECMNREMAVSFDERCDKNCDSCNLLYAQGTIGEIKETYKMGIKALEEVRQYRALGTVEELKTIKEMHWDCSIKHLTGECSYNETGCSDCIGREKIRKALEKQIAKKPIHVRYKPRTINRMHHHVYCGVCGKYEQRVCMEDNYCRRCGTKIDWGNEDAE